MPIEKNQPYRFVFSSRKTDGTGNNATAPTLTISKDGGTAAPLTAPAPVPSSGFTWYIDLTASQMNANSVVIEHSGSGLEVWGLTLCPEASYTAARGVKLDSIAGDRVIASSVWNYTYDGDSTQGDVLAYHTQYLDRLTRCVSLTFGTVASSTATTVTFNTNLGAGIDGSYINCLAVVTNGAGLVRQVRRVSGYVAATKTLTVSRAWELNPSAGFTVDIVPAVVALLDVLGSVTVGGFAAGVTSPDTSAITAVKAKTDTLPAVPAAKADADAATTAASAAKASADAAARPGAAMALTSSERTSLVSAVWNATSRTLSNVSSTVLDALGSMIETVTGGVNRYKASALAATPAAGGGASGVQLVALPLSVRDKSIVNLTAGDTGPSRMAELRDGNNLPVILPEGATVQYLLRPRATLSGTTPAPIIAAASIVSGDLGVVRFDFTDDLPIPSAGQWRENWQVDLPGGQTNTFPSDGFTAVAIR